MIRNALRNLLGRNTRPMVYRETWECPGAPTIVTYRHIGSRRPARVFN